MIFAIIAKIRYDSEICYHSENSFIVKIENFTMHTNFRYDSENSNVAKFWHFSSLFHCFLRLLFPLLYSIFSSFDILHSRLAEIDRKSYEIDGNQREFVKIGLTRRFGFQFMQKKTTKKALECDQKNSRDPNMSIGLIITISIQKALKTY